MIMQKKAVSALVATVLLILITVAAVGIIWGAIMPMINQATQYGQACMNARLNINTDGGYTCFNGTGTSTPGRVLVNIERGAESFDLQGIQISVSGGGSAKVWMVKNGQTPLGPAGENGTVTQIPQNGSGLLLDVPGVNEARTYGITSGLTTASEVAVAVVVKLGQTEKVCDVSSRVALTPCRAT
jgi:flagellin-like protein